MKGRSRRKRAWKGAKARLLRNWRMNYRAPRALKTEKGEDMRKNGR